MDKVINSYETLFIVDVTAGDDAVNTAVDKFTSLIADNAEIVEIAKWGKRRLAYPINDMPEGYYVVVTYKAEPNFPAELERVMGITDGILRYMVIRLEEKKAKSKPAPAKAVEEAPAAEAENAEA